MSNEPKHTATPWRLDQDGDIQTVDVYFDTEPILIATVIQIEDAARIVQCVNACEGMDDPEKEIKIMRELESKFKEDLKRANERGDSNRKMMVEQSEMNVIMKRELESLRAENAELIEALREIKRTYLQSEYVREIAKQTLSKYENTEPNLKSSQP